MHIHFSAKRVPDVGEIFQSKITYFPGSAYEVPAGKQLIVTGFAVEHTWLYVLAMPVDPSLRAMVPGPCYVGGVDVPRWGFERCPDAKMALHLLRETLEPTRKYDPQNGGDDSGLPTELYNMVCRYLNHEP